jgi:hypothetical protein
MTLVTIVAIPNADNTGLDLDRLEKVEDLDPEIARNMLHYGTAREPSDEELAAYRKTQAGKKTANAGDKTGASGEPARVPDGKPRIEEPVPEPAPPAETGPAR